MCDEWKRKCKHICIRLLFGHCERCPEWVSSSIFVESNTVIKDNMQQPCSLLYKNFQVCRYVAWRVSTDMTFFFKLAITLQCFSEFCRCRRHHRHHFKQKLCSCLVSLMNDRERYWQMGYCDGDGESFD